MQDTPTDNTYKKIPLKQLKIGMYVLEVVTKKNKVSVKSEGYIQSQSGIIKLKKAGIESVIVDPSREKSSTKQKEKVTLPPSVSLKDRFKDQVSGVSFEQEMKTAGKLYDDAKKLQKKVFSNINLNQEIDIAEVQESTDAIVDSIFRNQDALSCITRLRIKDEYLLEHSLNVSILMSIFAKHLALERSVIEQLALGAFLHDIGKIKIPSEILNKPGKLTADEYQIIKTHVALGGDVLNETNGISDIVLGTVLEHHERLNGTGYPTGLSEESLNQYSRMIAIVDSYDAMTAERVYKAGMHPINAFKNLISESPTAYDVELVEKFVGCLGVYPVGTLVKLKSGKLGLISQLNKHKPLQPKVKVFYNTRMNQAIAMEELDLSQSKVNDHIEACIKKDDYNLNLLGFFKLAFDY